ncbi:Zinc finger protein 511 [Chionoecetes opilio]|uniref:Zinc finger protein 511 n=1 Tax=Chionoecetes opilio TaxID=41210 RepID=A0A8J4Y433_CHIOP|nr:Zinc finger protein 511 [Chionoecetes opilio]
MIQMHRDEFVAVERGLRTTLVPYLPYTLESMYSRGAQDQTYNGFVACTYVLMSNDDCWSYVSSLGVYHHNWYSPLLVQGLTRCDPLAKIPCIDVDEEDFLHPSIDPIPCSIGGCKKVFTTVAEYAAHQRSSHQHVCSSCRHSFATHHLLDLHLLEVHDTLFQLMAEKKPSYQCLLETCPEKFKNPTERKIHCIEIHKFPANFRFDLSWRKLEKNKSKNAKINPAEESQMDCEVIGTKDENSSGHNSESNEATGTRLQNENVKKSPRVPYNLSFGVGVARGFSRGSRGNRGRRKGGTHWHQRKQASHNSRINIEEVNMNDLEAALPEEAKML